MNVISIVFQDALTTDLLRFVSREGEYADWIIKVTYTVNLHLVSVKRTVV